MSNRQVVLFDLDGTLVDTARDLGAALNHVLRLHNKAEVSYEQYRPASSHGVRGLLQLALGDELEHFDFQLLRHQFLEYYHEHNGRFSQLFHTGDELLHYLSQQQIPWGIVTNKPYKFAAQVCKALKLGDCRILIGGDSLAARKPEPTSLWVAAHKLGTPARSCWYIGDAERDIQAGRRAGMQTVLANYGYLSCLDQPQHWQANHAIDSLAELTSILHKTD